MWTWAASHWYVRPSAVRIASLPLRFRRVQPFGAGGVWGSSLEKSNSTTSGRRGAYCQGWSLFRKLAQGSALVWGAQGGSTCPLCPVTSDTWLALFADSARVRWCQPGTALRSAQMRVPWVQPWRADTRASYSRAVTLFARSAGSDDRVAHNPSPVQIWAANSVPAAASLLTAFEHKFAAALAGPDRPSRISALQASHVCGQIASDRSRSLGSGGSQIWSWTSKPRPSIRCTRSSIHDLLFRGCTNLAIRCNW